MQEHIWNEVIVKKIIVFVSCIIVSLSAGAAAVDIVDLYGIDQPISEAIIKKYAKEISHIELYLQEEFARALPGEEINDSTEKIVKKREALIEKITKEYGFKFVDFQTVLYPNNDTVYTTIEVVDKDHPERLRFVSVDPMGHHVKEEGKNRTDLIDKMIEYTNTGFRLLMDHQLSAKLSSCPVYHCVVGFEHPKLKRYLTMFNQGAIKERSFIIETLNHDNDPERRAAAAFLVGHFRDPHEIITVLSSHVGDKNEGVRNNVMRVIAETIVKAHITQLDVAPFLDALDSPYTTDRNKALWVLLGVVDDKVSSLPIIQNGGDKLLALLQLKQPNNHDLAYSILKKISGKDFGPTNVAAWTKWVSTAKNQAT